MFKRVQLLLALLLTASLLLAACGQPAPVEEPVVDAPQQEVVVEAAPPVLDVPILLSGFWASVPADKGFGAVSAVKLNEELAEKALFLLDVREAAEIETDGYIAGAVNIPIRELLKNLDKLPALNEAVVVYCGSGHRGGLALEALKLLGYTDVRNLGGGTGAWKKAELPLVAGSTPAAEAIGSPAIANQALFEALDAYLSNLPEGFASIKADALATELAENAPLLIDVRTQAEKDKDGYIEGALHIPFSDFLGSLDRLPADKDSAIVVYCASGHRGAMVQMALHLLGYTDVRNLGGGLGAWKTAGMPVAGYVDWAAVLGEFVSVLPADQGFYSVNADSLNALLAEQPVFLLDVRESAEIEASGYITGAINVPIRDLLKNLDKLPAPTEKIVIYCGSGHRGAIGMAALRLLGYADVVNLGGGTGAWTKGGFALDPGLPAAPAALSTPEVDAARLAALDAYLSALPEGFSTVKAADLNVEFTASPAPVVLDVRTEAEKTADGYIEGALWIPVNDLPANLAQLPADKAAPIVVTCKSGHRGGIAMLYLNLLGYSNVRNLGGGMNAWAAAELPVVQ